MFTMKSFSKFMFLMATVTCLGQPLTAQHRSIPDALPLTEENIEWQREVYRILDLTTPENGGLYSPMVPSARQQGLFPCLFALAAEKKVPVYRYSIDGNELLEKKGEIEITEVLRNYHIPYTVSEGTVRVERENLPVSSVMAYFIRERIGYDLTNSMFTTRVMAICPVLVEQDDFSYEQVRYPLFWMSYEDIRPAMKKLQVIGDYRNTAERISMDDFFTLNRYKGEIFRVANALGTNLRQTADTDSTFLARQKRVEHELQEVRKPVYNIYYVPEDRVKKTAPRKRRFRLPWQKREITE